MEHTWLMLVLLCFCFLLMQTTQGVNGQCSTPPINQAVYEGTLNTAMHCDSPTKVSWTFQPTADESFNYKVTDYDENVPPEYTNLFIVDPIRPTDLIIRTAQANATMPPMATAGLYVAQVNGGLHKYGAKLIVIHSGPDCSCVPLNSSSKVELSCTATLADSIVHSIPVMITWVVNGAVYATDALRRRKMDRYMFTDTSTISVDGSSLKSYQCMLTFGRPVNAQYGFVASNAPTFSKSCSGPVCPIRYSQPTTTAATQKTTSSLASTTHKFLPIFPGPIMHPKQQEDLLKLIYMNPKRREMSRE